MEPPGPHEAARDAIRHGPRLPRLADLAARRYGFGDSDGGFGVLYPESLDDFDRAAGEFIPDGFVLVYGFEGLPDGYEVLVPESVYLGELAAALSAAGHAAEAEQVRSLAGQRHAG